MSTAHDFVIRHRLVDTRLRLGLDDVSWARCVLIPNCSSGVYTGNTRVGKGPEVVCAALGIDQVVVATLKMRLARGMHHEKLMNAADQLLGSRVQLIQRRPVLSSEPDGPESPAQRIVAVCGLGLQRRRQIGTVGRHHHRRVNSGDRGLDNGEEFVDSVGAGAR